MLAGLVPANANANANANADAGAAPAERAPVVDAPSRDADAAVRPARPDAGPDDLYDGLPPCTMSGTPGDDRIVGTPGRDVICGGLGDDVILAGGGDDIVLAGGGDDLVRAGAGDDRVDGARGDDTLRGGPGSDRLVGAWGVDFIRGGRGGDQISRGAPLRFTPWIVFVSPRYTLPAGTTLHLDFRQGECVKYGRSHAVTVPSSSMLPMFETDDPSIFDACTYKPSTGSWSVLVTTPEGARYPGSVYISTGVPNPFVHTVAAGCSIQNVSCSDSRWSGGEGLHVTLSMDFGPITGPDPSPFPTQPPTLACGTIAVRIPNEGMTLNESNGHICTSEGLPLPDISATGLPPGVTLRRWPTPMDSWLVLEGRVDGTYGMTWDARVRATTPTGWTREHRFTIWIAPGPED